MESTQSPNHPVTQSSNHPIAQSPTLFVAGIWMLVLAASLLLCGSSSALGYLVAPFLVKNRDSVVQVNILLGSSAALGLGFGVVWAWQGILTLGRRAPSAATFASPHTLVWVFAFLLVLVLGMGALAIKPVAAFAFPPLHFLASVIPPLALLGYAAQRLNVTSGLRALMAALSWGTLGSTLLAVILEVISGVIIVALGIIALSLMPEGAVRMEQLRGMLDSLRMADEGTIARRLFSDPLVVGAVMVYVVGIIPFVEEALKTLIVAFADPQRTTARDALLWGIAAGAGFALVENTLTTGNALNVWAMAMLTRVGATVIHVANGVTMARGWYTARVERRWGSLLIAYGVSVFWHAAWNVLAIGQGISVAVGLNEAGAMSLSATPSFWLLLALSFGLLVLTFGGAGWIAYAVQTAHDSSEVSLRGAS